MPSLAQQLVALLRRMGDRWEPRRTVFLFQDADGQLVFGCNIDGAVQFATDARYRAAWANAERACLVRAQENW